MTVYQTSAARIQRIEGQSPPDTRSASAPRKRSLYHCEVRLPGRDKAIVTNRKIAGYLLADTHPIGRHKALWLLRFGFTVEDPGGLVAALKLHANDHEIARIENSPFGKRYVIEGRLMTPDGRNPLARAIWFVDSGSDRPTLVTVYPIRGLER